MVKLTSILCVLALASPGIAGGRTTFARQTAFSACHAENICGVGPNGGFASQGTRTTCTSITFKPDGTYVMRDDDRSAQGRYRLDGRRVRLTPRGSRTATQTLTLSADGTTLDKMTRVSTR